MEKRLLMVLSEIEKAISESNIDGFKKFSNSIDFGNADYQITLKDYYENTSNLIRNTNLVILSSKHNQVQILEYLFSSDSKILYKLSVGIGRPTILPDDEDETRHNAFYYAIRSRNVKLIDILINKWPDNYFDDHLEKLDDILSKAYEELKLKNVPLSDEMEIFVEKKLIKLRFYSNASRNDVSFRGDLNNIRERIELILENINLLKNNYSNTEEVDEIFLFVAKFIAQNIHTLKRQLKSSYIRLPWEQIEFFLVCFVSSHTQWKEINVFYRAALDKRKLLNHLKNFGKKLEDEKNMMKGMHIIELSRLPKLSREKVVAEIISSHPPFEELYMDYRQIKDIHSLENISVNIKLALSADPKERDGQLIITRVLQVIGEYLKNTLLSPNLCETVSDLFLLSLPKNARTIITGLRDSLSHAPLKIEENRNRVNFFINVQNDTKEVNDVVTDILYKNKMKIIGMLLTKIIKSENLNEIIEVTEVFRTVAIEKNPENFKMLEHQKLANLVQELRDTIPEKTDYENALLKEMNSIISAAGTPSENIKFEYITGLAFLKAVSSGFTDNKIDHTVIKAIKFRANLVLKIITPKIEPRNLKEISQLSRILSNSVQSRIIPHAQLDKINRAVYEIFYNVQFRTGDIKWLEELRAKLNEKDSFFPRHKPWKSDNVTEEKCNDLLVRKLSELKSILSKNFSSESLIENLSSYKSDKKLQAVVEMLVLDIMSILGTSNNYLENNVLCFDDYTPLLIGKCLRNHLAHDNTLVDVLFSDPPLTIILNAIMLTKENIMSSNKKIGKMVSNDTLKLREKYNQSLDTITDQKRLFVALEEGNLKLLICCLKRGSDIYARSINSWTTLHYAAKGPSLEVFKFILSQNLDVKAKDINDQTPLHIAAAHGRQNIVEYFVKETGLYIDELNNTGKTPLHVAAQHGHKDTVEVLLKYKANTLLQDVGGFSPLHYAIINNHIDVAQILLEKDVYVNINQAAGGFTPLHAASESGHLEIVNFLLQNKADVNANDERNWTPLHAAAYNGYREIVNALILKGADVNARVINGCTPLYYAVENGDEKIVNILLNHEANVNAVEKNHTFAPLHYATKNGQEEIVTALLKNKAKTNVATVDGMTPLHFGVIGGHLKIVDVLLKHGVDIHAKDKNNLAPLHYGAENGHREVVELLLKNGAIINAADHNGLTPLHLTAFKGHKDVIDVLIKNKALVNVQNVKGETPLHAAAVNGNKDIIDLLIKHNAGVNAKNGVGMTPLHVAARTGNGDAITLLIKYKAEVNPRADHGFTPLHAAVGGDHKDVVNILIKNKAVVDAGGFKDGTPLHLAVEGGFKEIVEILVANGANVNVISKDVTPLISAIKCNHREIVEVLIANGAQVNVECNKTFVTSNSCWIQRYC